MIQGRIRLLFALTSTLFAASPASAASQLNFFFHDTENFTAAKRARLNAIAELAERVMNSSAFRDKVLNFRSKIVRDGKVVYTKSFIDNDGLSNKKILERIEDGTENFFQEPKYNPPRANETADFYVSLYKGVQGVVGNTIKGKRYININDYYFSTRSKAYMAGNLVHEWLHKLGFSHAVNLNATRPYSVPYGIGEIVRDMAEKLSSD